MKTEDLIKNCLPQHAKHALANPACRTSDSLNQLREGERSLRNTFHRPHTISYRLSDEHYLKAIQEIDGTGLTIHEWCRRVVLDKLNQEYRLSKNEELLFKQFVRSHYLLANAIQLLAEDRLTPDEWKKLRTFATEKIDIIATRSLAQFSTLLH